MSRCFPFPPPGYEKKARPDDDANLLLKENCKEKKHKKHKDKRKKERKEKEDKERSSEKHKEKKDWKHKHKDKKDKNRDKEGKKAPPEEKKIVGPSDHQNGTKLGPISTWVDQAHNCRFLLELEKRVRNDSGAREIQNVDKISLTDCSSKSTGKVFKSNIDILVEGDQKLKHKGEESRMPNGQRLKIDAMPMENGFVCHILEKEPKMVEGGFWQVEKASEKQNEQKDKNKHKKNEGRADKHKDGDREKKSKSKNKKRKKEKEKEEKMEVSTTLQTKLRDDANNSVDIENDRGFNLSKQSNAKNRNLGKRKEPEMNGFFHGAEIPLNKLRRPLSSEEVTQNGSRIDASNGGVQFALERDAAVKKHKLYSMVSPSNSVVENGSNLEKSQTAKNFALKRQEATSNCHKARYSLSSSNSTLGIVRRLEPCQTAISFASMDQGVLTNHTLDKKVLSAQPVTENGTKSPFSQSSYLTSSERQGVVCKKLEDREPRNNAVELKKTNAKSLRHAALGELKETVETPMKPPHPDSKYLSEILSVPKVEWSDVDEQTWLFTCEDHQSKKPKIDSMMLEETKQVWAEPLRIESGDVTALPYVIPY